jgi:stage II sporulation protein D
MLWKVKTPPLKGIRCNFCKNSPHFQWESVTGLDDIEERLKESKYKISGIKSIEITERDRSGRVSWLIIKSKAGRMKITGKDFRHIIGPRLIKSTNFNINIKNSTVYFKGKGWGHGVGMCQWGAFSMAKKRKTIEEILEFYYPGSQIMQLKD